LQDVAVRFPSAAAYHEFVETMSPCAQYPFWSGADYALQEAIFEGAVKSGDRSTFRLLLAKDGRCASELNAPLFSILRRNPQAFLVAFAGLSAAQQRIAASTQYDFNLALDEQLLPAGVLRDLPPELSEAAKLFNALLAEEAKR
jgi:hypothetical protein